MERYQNRGGDSGVVGFEIGDDSITVQFRDNSLYLCSGQLKLATTLDFFQYRFPIRLGVTHRYSHAALSSCNTRRYSL